MGRTRYKVPKEGRPFAELPAAALRAVLREGYTKLDLRADVLAGSVVGIVALPLAMALAIAVGAPPQHGLYTAIVAGFLIALLGGSRGQASGPTAAFVVILAPVLTRFGLAGLLVAGLMAGVMLVGLGVLRLGSLIQFIPHPVTRGFTAGIGVVIATLQLKDLLGLRVEKMPEHFAERVHALFLARGTLRPVELLVGLLTLALLVTLPRVVDKVPAPLIALPVAALVAVGIGAIWPAYALDTIATRFHYELNGQLVGGIPNLPPLPVLPWNLPGPGGEELHLSLATIRRLMPSAFAICMLGAIESLLSAVVADGMAGTKHDPDAELIAQGVGNIVGPFFGAIAATGAIARTATNVRAGARSPIAAMVHAVVILLCVLILAPLVSFLPMTTLAALLVLVAWNMSEAAHFGRMLKVGPRSDVAVLLVCFSLTVIFDMVIAVTIGIVLAALLFMRSMAAITHARLVEDVHPRLNVKLPRGVLIYEIRGPLFFGAAESAMEALHSLGEHVKSVIIDLDSVPTMDATGAVALESALARLYKDGAQVILVHLHPQPHRVLRDSDVLEQRGVRLAPSMEVALEWVGAAPAGAPLPAVS